MRFDKALKYIFHEYCVPFRSASQIVKILTGLPSYIDLLGLIVLIFICFFFQTFFICFQKSDGANIKNFKTTKQKSCIKDTFRQFVSDNDAVMNTYLRRLKSIQATQEVSPFFKSHEVNRSLYSKVTFFVSLTILLTIYDFVVCSLVCLFSIVWLSAYIANNMNKDQTAPLGMQGKLYSVAITIFLFLNQYIHCRFSEELSNSDGSLGHPKHITDVLETNNKFYTKNLLIWVHCPISTKQ